MVQYINGRQLRNKSESHNSDCTFSRVLLFFLKWDFIVETKISRCATI